MFVENKIDALKALDWLIEGNNDYINSERNHHGDISHEKRIHTHYHGQTPFAVIVTCSDSRVIPESIFMKGIGDLFVIRIAGNILDDYGYGSIEYAIEHLGCKLIMIMGHTRCGAIAASMDGSHEGFVGTITKQIKKNIGHTTNALYATKQNVRAAIRALEENPLIKRHQNDGLLIVGSIYHTSSGKVELMK